MRRKVIAAIYIYAVYSLLFAQPNSKIDLIKRVGVFKVAVYASTTFPFFFTDGNGKLAGFDIDLARSIADALNVSVVFDRSATTFDDVLRLVEDKKVDAGISMLSITPKRSMHVIFTTPYAKISQIIIGNRFCNDYAKVSPLVISEKKGTAYVEMARSFFPSVTVCETDTWEEAVENTVRNISQITLRDEIGLYTAIKNEKKLLLDITVTPIPDVYDHICIAVNQEADCFASWLNLFLQKRGYPKMTAEILEIYE